jgi:small subunit ribosomal protein S16
MATRIRLQRHGKKGKPFFHIVVADSRSKRDGRYIEKLGTYNPNTNPATVDLDFDRSVHWVSVGASPSDTAKAILSYKGVLMKEHLMRGVTKGALTEEQMEAKYTKWSEEKSGRIDQKVSNLSKAQDEESRARLAAEKEKNDARAAAIAEANRPPEEETPAEAAPAEEAAPVEEAPLEAAPAEEVKAEEAAPAEESKTDEASEEKKEG